MARRAARTITIGSSADVARRAARTITIGSSTDVARRAARTITVGSNADVARRAARMIKILIEVVDPPTAGRIGAGIPEPILVEDSARAWRSRLSPTGWEVNIGHLDYGALATDSRARLRYLVALFAKDLTLSVSHPAHEAVLDQMLDVLSLSERNLLRQR